MEKLKVPSRSNSEEELKELKNEYLKNQVAVKYIEKLGIPEELIDKEIVKIGEFVSDLNYCKKCPGLDKCNKDTPRLCTKIIYSEGVVDRQVVPCKKYLDFMLFKKQFLVRDFPEDYLTHSLKNANQTQERKNLVERYKNIIKNNLHEWIYLVGEEGTGRSYIAALLAVEEAKNKRGPVCFIDAAKRFKELGSLKGEAFNSLIEKYMNVPFLVIDDLGNEYKSDFVRDSILFQILNYRSKNNLFTIITSDFSIDDICLMYQTNIASKPKIEQIKRMLKKNCQTEINLGSISIY